MKISIQKSDLLSIITCGYGIVDRKPTIPALSHLLLDASSDDSLTMYATDLDHSIVAKTKCSVKSAGKAIVLAQTLYDVIRKCSDAPIEIIKKENTLAINSDRSKFNLSCLPDIEFPEFPVFNPSYEVKLQTSLLRKLIDKTSFSMSLEEARYYLNGTYIHTRSGKLCAATTDSHRLSVCEIPITERAVSGVILSRKTIFEIRKLLDKQDEFVSVAFTDSQVRFSFENEILIARLVEGNFPDYKRVIPDKSSANFIVNRNKFKEVVDRASVISENNNKIVRLELSKNNLKISSIQTNLGSAEEDFEVDYDGEEWKAGFNSRYLLDVAEHISGNNMKLFITDSLSPVLIIDPDDNAYSFVVMPLRV